MADAVPGVASPTLPLAPVACAVGLGGACVLAWIAAAALIGPPPAYHGPQDYIGPLRWTVTWLWLAPLPGIGIFAVRCANFINGELWGKPTNVPWGFIVEPSTLHPSQRAEALRMCERFSIDPCVLHVHASQLYEGFLEGLVVFAILWIYTAKPRPRLAPAGLFLLCYGVFRFAVEFVRVPDENRGYLLFDWVTMGQILSTPMIVAGLIMLIVAYRRNDPTGNVGGSR